MTAAPPGSVTLAPVQARGADFSQFQGVVDWTLAGPAIDFAYIRFADGFYRDTKFSVNWSGSFQRCELRGVYHYLRSSLDAHVQAERLCAALTSSEHGIGELPPAIDVEKHDGTAAQIEDHIAAWNLVVERELGVLPVVYTGPWFWDFWVKSARFVHLPLWVAEYPEGVLPSAPPLLPAPWPTWTLWQYTNRGQIPGCAKRVDLNVFNGDRNALKAFAFARRISHAATLAP